MTENQLTQLKNDAKTTVHFDLLLIKILIGFQWSPLFFVCTIIMFACGGNASKNINSQDGTHVFRKANFGMNAAQVKSGEIAELTSESSEKLIYTADMGEGDSTDIIYHFNPSDKLIEIEFNLYFDSSEDATKIHAGLLRQFDKDYKATGNNSWLGKLGDENFQVFARRSESITRPGLYIVWREL